MFVAELTFRKTEKHLPDEAVGALYQFLGVLEKNGQVLSDHDQIAERRDAYQIFVTVPERKSLNQNHDHKWVYEARLSLKKAGLRRPVVRIVGSWPEAPKLCQCVKSEWLMLMTNYLARESPLRCGDCCGQVPLYRIPPTSGDDYHNIIDWQKDYRACDSLQMHCQTGERFGIREMSSHESSLSRRGRAICKAIEDTLQVPTYYYLDHPNGKSHAAEKKRKCPSCHHEWLLDQAIHRYMNFRCEACRLLSNIAWDLQP